jgi:hypothetical protein
MAQTLGLAERAAARLLHACAALGLVRVTDGLFSNVPIVEKYLVQGRPTYIGGYLQMFDALGYHRWEQLGQALRRNAPVEAPDHLYRYLNDHADEARTFLAAQHEGSASLGHALAQRIDFTPFRCLLDLGGGMGTYTIEILQRYPHLQAIIFDFPQDCHMASAALHQAGLCERTQTVAGDYENDPLPHGPDVVLWSGNLHASSPPRCLQILQKLQALLPPHGMVVIHDYVLDDTGTEPLLPALLALHLTLVSTDGQVYRAAELRALLTQAGFTRVSVQSFLPGHSSLVLAHVSTPPAQGKPASA